MKEFTIRVKMRERWIPHFMSMLRYIESLGSVGASRMVSIYADGDGDFQAKFEADVDWEIKEPIKDDDGDRIYDAG